MKRRPLEAVEYFGTSFKTVGKRRRAEGRRWKPVAGNTLGGFGVGKPVEDGGAVGGDGRVLIGR